jgi:predicted DNA-binding transcriptional regulator AlpA
MQRVNGIEEASILPTAIADGKPIRQLIKAAEVAGKLGVSISWVVQHASGRRKPYLPAVKMGPGRSPLRFDPADVEKFIDECRRIAGQKAQYAGR